MTEELSTGEGRRPRRPAAALVAAMLAALVALMPGTASAAAPQVVPLINCYYPHSDGSITVVLGYRSTYTATRTIPRGTNNYSTPSTYTASLPTTFKPGTNNGVATLRIAARDLTWNTSWYLDGSNLSYLNVTSATPACTQAQLPAFANGAAITVVLLLAGLTGVLVVRRLRRAALRTSFPKSTSHASGGDHA